MSDRVYAIVDIETTGGSSGNRVTEIAIIKTNGFEIIDTFETLVDPDAFIPHSISLLTGITNEMVESAPLFEHVADDIMAFLDGCIFVAHNVSFDYSIIKNHFDDLRIPFQFKKLCTVRLARGIIKGLPSYSLGKLCKQLSISNDNRHRAMGDAKATIELFHLLQQRDENNFIDYSLNQLNKEASLPPNLSREEYLTLPSTAGVYYLLGEKMEVLYVGKAKNIRQRVTTHFTEKTRKKSELLRKIHHVSFEETGNEFVAFLMESAEIKKHYPPYNKAQKSKHQAYYVSFYSGQDEIYRVEVFNKKYGGNHLQSFTSMTMARDYLYLLVNEHGLCPKVTGLERTKGSCYLGANCELCSGKLSKKEYNAKVKAIGEDENRKSMLIFGQGREEQESAVVYIKEGEYQGFGFVYSDQDPSLDQIINEITPYRQNSDTKRIIRQFLNSGLTRQYKIVELTEQELDKHASMNG